ncbi:MFS general substrate transporter [Tothia fuscella]|uniref:MFS general substrate transporter n=1 Tax=Tothia fuscella TaxID=1048955 RepID=A0A9P4P213_9PEZI|nr:MFS general substrate transporter [Tothia fuscella]
MVPTALNFISITKRAIISAPVAEVMGDKEIQNTGEREITLSSARLISLTLVLSLAAFLNTLGIQAAVIILPSIGKALHIPDSRQQWVVSAYSLTFGCFLLLWGRIADVYGKRLIFIVGSAWFTAISIAIPFAPNEITFDVLRGLQGLGAAATAYWAWQFPSMCLSVFGADTLYPTLLLFTAQSLPQTDQALGGALINAVGQVGRAISLAIVTAIQAAVIASEKGVEVSDIGSAVEVGVGDSALLKGLRAASWTDFALAAAAFSVVLIIFRGVGKIGAVQKT